MKLRNVIAGLVLTSAITASAGPMTSGKMISPAAPESREGFFISAVGGPVWFQEISLSDTFVFRGDRYKVDLDVDFETGYGGTLALGYKLNSGWAFGLSVGYYTASADQADFDIKRRGRQLAEIRADLDDIDLDLTLVPVNFNITYGFPLTNSIYSYIGAGAGVTYSELDSDSIGEGDSWEFGAQGVAGFGFKITDNFGLKLGYRLLYTQVEDESLFGHALEAGFGLKF
jgi:opacity protein-like surface antigen